MYHELSAYFKEVYVILFVCVHCFKAFREGACFKIGGSVAGRKGNLGKVINKVQEHALMSAS